MPKTIFRHKVFLVLLGLLLTLALLEGGMRLAGLVFLKAQEYSKRSHFNKEGDAYRILCLGESTTSLGGKNSYPRQLEDILNAGPQDFNFTVINKGVPSISTMQIVSHLKAHLDKYKPHIVIVMMGINDAPDSFAEKGTSSPGGSDFFEHFRTYKLAKTIIAYLFPGKDKTEGDSLGRNLKKIETKIKEEPSAEKFVELAGIYRASNKPQKEKGAILAALELNPKHPEALGSLGLYYKRNGEYTAAIQAFNKALGESADMPERKNFRILLYAHLAECYKLKEEYKQAEEVYLTAIRYLPRHPGAYGCLGELYLEQERYDEAEMFLQRQLQINPKAVLFYGKLAHCYRRKGRDSAAEELLREALRINPDDITLHKELGSFLLTSKKYQEAEKVLETALKLSKRRSSQGEEIINIYNLLLASYEAQSKEGEALKIKEFLRSQKGHYNLKTYQNYQKLKDILAQRKIQLIAVQYPMRGLEPLKNMLQPAEDIIFVDNQEIFEKAIAREGYDTYFSDRFAGNFGHCTAKGNYLLADNIAKSVRNFLSIR